MSECWIVRPCTSDTPLFSPWPLWLVAGCCVAIGIGFCLAGAWLVLPFCGIEVLALWFAVNYLGHHQHDYERIYRTDGRLVLERHRGSRAEYHELHPYWARLRVHETRNGSICRLFIGSHGSEIEIGRQLGGEEKKALAGQLRRQLGV